MQRKGRIKMLKKLRKIAKEEPIWLSTILVAITTLITALNILLIIINLKGLL